MPKVHKLRRTYLIFRTWKSLELNNIKETCKGLTFCNHPMLKMTTYNPLSSPVIFREGVEGILPVQKHSAMLSVRKPRREVINPMLLTGLIYLKLIFHLNYIRNAFFLLKKKKRNKKVKFPYPSHRPSASSTPIPRLSPRIHY